MQLSIMRTIVLKCVLLLFIAVSLIVATTFAKDVIPGLALSSGEQGVKGGAIAQSTQADHREEIFIYARSRNSHDTRARLKDALKKDLISRNEYYGELAHMLSVSVDNPLDIVKEIVDSKNMYGYEVMTGIMEGNAILAESMAANERREIFDILINNKSELSGHVSEMGLVDMFRYESWLGSIRAFAKNDVEYYKFVDELLEKRIMDPREVFGVKYSLADSEIRNLSPAAKKNYEFYIHEYIKSYPSSKTAVYVNNRSKE